MEQGAIVPVTSSPPPSTTRNSSRDASASNQMPPRSMVDACNSILRGINKGRAGNAQFATPDDNGVVMDAQSMCIGELNMDSILSRLPYKKMLEDLFSGEGVKAPHVPVVTKAYEESMMREPIDASERPCVMGDMCECNMISSVNGFTGVAFVLPGDVANGDEEEEGKTGQHMCVLCHRKMVQSLFFDMVYCGVPHARGVIQRYGNICGQPGEYAREVCTRCCCFCC